MLMMKPRSNLENLDRDELLATVRRLLAEADALSSRISAVNEIGAAMNHTLDLDTIQRVIAKQAKWLLDFAHCSVCLRDGESWSIKTLFGEQEPTTVDVSTMENIAHTLKTGQPTLLRESTQSLFLTRYHSQLIIPLSADNTLLGTINFATIEPNSYTHDDMRIGYMLSLQLASAIRNANIMTELKHTQEELKLRVEELDAYGHTIAHDLKSPLSNILMRSQLLAFRFKDDIPAEALEFLSSIELSSKLMSRMIDQLLWLAKLRHSNEALSEVNVNWAVKSALQRFSHLIEDTKKPITVNVMPDLPATCGHEQWIEEVFANFISNAIKYMGDDNPAPSITIRGVVQGNQVRYEVVDNGIGIKKEDQTRLFEMFTRLHKTSAEGLGLGLSIVQRIITTLGGTIGVESVYGEGSTFWFSLPLHKENTPAKTDTPETTAESKESS